MRNNNGTVTINFNGHYFKGNEVCIDVASAQLRNIEPHIEYRQLI